MSLFNVQQAVGIVVGRNSQSSLSSNVSQLSVVLYCLPLTILVSSSCLKKITDGATEQLE